MNSRNQELREFENDGMESNESTSFIAIANFYSHCSKTSVIRIFKKSKRKWKKITKTKQQQQQQQQQKYILIGSTFLWGKV